MNIDKMIEALQICKKYADAAGVKDAYCSADHDMIMFPLMKGEPSKADAARLKKLGALVDEYDTWFTYV